MINKSPSGSACPYYYQGGELHPLKYGSFGADKEKLFRVMKAEEKFILRSAGQRNRRIWVDLYETTLDDEAIDVLAEHLEAIREKICRLCLVGCSFWNRRKIRKRLARSAPDLARQLQFFSDPEKAKHWLVSEQTGTHV